MIAWQMASLSDVLLDAKPGFACGENAPDGVFQFRMNNVTTEGRLDFSKKRRVPRDFRNLSAFLAEPGDVLFNATNSPELVGKSAFFPGHDEPAVFSNHFLRLRPRADILDGRFLAGWLALQFRKNVFQGMCRQWVNQATVGRNSLLALRVPLPPLAEQHRITAILEQAEALRETRRLALSKLVSLTDSLFLDLFGNPISNPFGWHVRSVGEFVADITNGLTRRRTEAEAGTDIVLRLRDIRSGWIDYSDVNRIALTPEESRRYEVVPGDLLFIRVNGNPEYVGRCAVFSGFSENVYFNDHIMRVKAKSGEVSPAFLAHVLNGERGKRQIALHRKTSAGQHTINQLGLKGITIPAPPVDLQYEFERRIAAIEKLEAAQRASLAKLNELFASLQHRAFRGEL